MESNIIVNYFVLNSPCKQILRVLLEYRFCKNDLHCGLSTKLLAAEWKTTCLWWRGRLLNILSNTEFYRQWMKWNVMHWYRCEKNTVNNWSYKYFFHFMSQWDSSTCFNIKKSIKKTDRSMIALFRWILPKYLTDINLNILSLHLQFDFVYFIYFIKYYNFNYKTRCHRVSLEQCWAIFSIYKNKTKSIFI